MYDKYAPIIPFVGMGGIYLNQTKNEVEKQAGRKLIRQEPEPDDAWERYTFDGAMTLFFSSADGRLVLLETQPGYRGRLASGIGTDTDEEQITVLDPTMIYDDFEEFYNSVEHGVQIETNIPEHKAVWISVFVPEISEIKR